MQLQSTAESSAVPKMAESHPILCWFWAAAFRHLCSALGSVSVPSLVGVCVLSMHIGNVCSLEELLGVPGRQLSTAEILIT